MLIQAAKPVSLLSPRSSHLRHVKEHKASQTLDRDHTELKPLKRRSLQQQTSNQFDACPATDYIYSGPTTDSFFDELSVNEFQSAIEFVVSS